MDEHTTMNYYKFVVRVRDQKGEEITNETYRNFPSEKEAYAFMLGFSDGTLAVHKSELLERQIEKIKQ